MRSHKITIWILAVFLLIVSSTSVMGALTDNIGSYYELEEDNQPYVDEVGNMNLSDIDGASDKVAGKIGFGQNITSTDGLEGGDLYESQNLTWSFWVYMYESADIKYLFTKWQSAGSDDRQILVSAEGDETLEVRIGYNSGQDQEIWDLSEKVNLNTWEHYVMTWDNTAKNWSIYVNGTYLNSHTFSNGMGTGSANFVIGQSNDYPSIDRPTNGAIDEFGIWTRVLSSSEISQLYNSGNGLQYPFSGGGATTDIDFTAVDDWNSTAIQSFSVNITWANTSTETHSTNNGTVTLLDVGNPGSLNVTYWNVTDYFDSTLLNEVITVNSSNSIQASMFQAYVCFNASEKVSGSAVTPDNITIEGTTHTSCFNLSADTYNVMAQKTGWYSQNQSFTVSALQNNTQTIQNLSYANLTIYAKDGVSGEYLSGYNLTIFSITEPGWGGEFASGVTNHSFYLINGTYNVSIAMPGYATTYGQANVTVGGHTNHTFTIYLSNSVSITIRDEITNDLITDNVTIRWSDNTTTWENVSTTGALFVSNITAGNYTLLFYSTNYSTRTYQITVGPSSHQFLTAYMISSTYSTIFTIKDIDTGSILDGVSITMYKLINSTWTTVESKVSDISGKAQFYYDPIANYRFYLSATDYEDYIFYLNPILFSTYDVYMTKTTVLNYSVDFDDISFIYSPTTFNNNENISLNFLISSPGGQLTDYGIIVTYPGGTDSDSGVNAIGEQLSVDVNITNATSFDYVVLEFNYTTSLSGTRSYTFNLPINVNVSGGTWLTNKDKTYGLGIFERLLIATLIIIFIVGIATMVGQALPGVALGLFVYGFLVFIGFVPLWAILPSMLIGVMFLIWKSGGY